MKRILLLVLVFTLYFHQTNAQNVDSIRVEQAGDFIRVYYKILDSNPNQTFRVTVLCSINGGLKSELTSISGDFGDNVTGGRSQYMILWDVLKDVEELVSVEFFVRAELMHDKSFIAEKRQKRNHGNFHVIGILDLYQFENILYGGRIGYFKKWGVSARYSFGKITDNWAEGFEGTDTEISIFNASIDIALKVAGDARGGLYIFAGPAYAKLKAEHSDEQNTLPSYYKNYAGLNFGLIPVFGRVSMNFNLTFYPYFNLEDDYNLRNVFFAVGLGFNL
jgi:hypothetical protein